MAAVIGVSGGATRLIPWPRKDVDGRVAEPILTAREREVARLVERGLTDRAIARELGISDRTVGAHIQNILNKLGAANRAQIAAWSAQRTDQGARAVQPAALALARVAPVPMPSVKRGPRLSPRLSAFVLSTLILTMLLPADHAIQPPSATAGISSGREDLVYEADFDNSGRGFSIRYANNGPDASSVDFVNGGVEYSVLKPNGSTGNHPVLAPLPAYFAEYVISVKPGSSLAFWILFSSDDPNKYPMFYLDIETAVETMQLGYRPANSLADTALGPQVRLKGLQTGRQFTISTLVQPPMYRVFLDGLRVIDVMHQSVIRPIAPAFSVIGDTGTVRLSAMRIYRTA